MLVLGAVAVLAPLFSSVWGVAIVGLAILLSGVIELVDAWVTDGRHLPYSRGAFSVLAGALISFQTALVFSGLADVPERVASGRRRTQHRSRHSRHGAGQPRVGLHQRQRECHHHPARVAATRQPRAAGLWPGFGSEMTATSSTVSFWP
ncbi:MAG: DUF308 domain-containing protein [Acidobacteria bacterium]|nr:DUF308 domain-containing protein [Acidobacteriota bacterium]